MNIQKSVLSKHKANEDMPMRKVSGAKVCKSLQKSAKVWKSVETCTKTTRLSLSDVERGEK